MSIILDICYFKKTKKKHFSYFQISKYEGLSEDFTTTFKVISNCLTSMDLQWKRLTKIFSGNNKEVPKNGQQFVKVQKLRSKYIDCWKVFRTSHYPVNTVLIGKDTASIFSFCQKIENICDVGTRTAESIFLYLDTKDDEYLVCETEAVFQTECMQHTRSDMKSLIQTVSQIVQNALTNEQKGNFSEARSDYRKALIYVKEYNKTLHHEYQIFLLKDVTSHLEYIEKNWDSWEKLISSSSPNPHFKIFNINDIVTVLQMHVYKEFIELKKQFLIEKTVSGLFEDWKGMTSFVFMIWATVNFALNSSDKNTPEENSRPFQPWYTPDEERSIVCDESLANDVLKNVARIVMSKKGIIRNKEGMEVRSCTTLKIAFCELFAKNRKKYSTLKKMNKLIFGVSVSPQMMISNSESETAEFVDDNLSFDAVKSFDDVKTCHFEEDSTTTNSASHSMTSNSASHRQLTISRNDSDDERGL